MAINSFQSIKGEILAAVGPSPTVAKSCDCSMREWNVLFVEDFLRLFSVDRKHLSDRLMCTSVTGTESLLNIHMPELFLVAHTFDQDLH